MKLSRFTYILFLLIVFGCGTKHQATGGSSSKNNIEDKYSHLLGVNKENISDRKLYAFIDDWYGTPYQYGGKTKKGIDCSGFTILLYKEVFGKELCGTSSSLYNQCKKISKEELKEGDLVFFKIESKDISHIGIYLQNNKFVHASTKAGIIVNDLNEVYYKKYFAGGGRMK
ncbi:MAG: C40 family peptidase [Bacteroidetes bacterium]|nr:C40 family peptidase [Bacteroidota bacterium]